MIQTSKPHWGGTRNGKSAIPSAFALRQPWPSDFHKIWRRRPSNSIVQNVRDLNALDGTEDDAVYNDEMPEVADDDMEDEFETDSEEDDDD